MVMMAVVTEVNNGYLMVRDLSTNQEVRVNVNNTQNLKPGDQIMIYYNGAMTASIPPQISAISIQVVQSTPNWPTPQPPTYEARVMVVEKRTDSLLVRNRSDNSLMVVNTPYARYFCNGQMVIVTYSAMTRSIPPQVNAIDILPDCQ